jgi:hypothetical protein
MSNASNYVRKGSARKAKAWRITSIQPYIRGAITLFFGDVDKRAHVIPEWVGRNNPQVGGYFVVEDLDGPEHRCYYADAAVFVADFTEEA